jgi:peptidyl-prolyl cis-trans isomerase SurA
MKPLWAIAAIFAILILEPLSLYGQSAVVSDAARGTAGKPVVLDRVVAIINGSVILESDVNEELRFAELEPFSTTPGSDNLKRAMRRLANRTLILQQMKEQDQLGVTVPDEDVQKAISDLREHLPQCRTYHCTTEEGWKAFLAAHDLTETEVFDHWKQRLSILRFIDLRFRSGVRIPSQEIEDYYKKSIVPVYQKQNQKPPTLDQLSLRIQEILLQQHVNGLLQDWLKTLRDEGSVQILDPAYGESSGHAEEED